MSMECLLSLSLLVSLQNGVKIFEGTPLPVTCEEDVFNYLDIPYQEPKDRDWFSSLTVLYGITASMLTHTTQLTIGLFQLIGIHPHGGVNFDLPPKKA